jgi:hypothetical protein
MTKAQAFLLIGGLPWPMPLGVDRACLAGIDRYLDCRSRIITAIGLGDLGALPAYASS